MRAAQLADGWRVEREQRRKGDRDEVAPALFTDKTGTLTEGHISFTQSLDWQGKPNENVQVLGLACSDRTGNELDRALHSASIATQNGDLGWPALDRLPFDH